MNLNLMMIYQGLTGWGLVESASLSSSHEWRHADSRASVPLGSVTVTILGLLVLAPITRRWSAGGDDNQSRASDTGAPGPGNGDEERGLVLVALPSLSIERGTRPGRSCGVAGDMGDGSLVELSSKLELVAV